MARHLDLRHDRHEARACVGDDLADIVLRIEATVRLAVEAPRGRVLVLSTDERLTAPRAHLRETRVLLDLEAPPLVVGQVPVEAVDRKSTRLNSSHGYISYAVFCLKKKKKRHLCTPLRFRHHIILPRST